MNYKIKYQKGGFNYDSTSSSESELDTLSSEKDYKTQQLKIPINLNMMNMDLILAI